MGELVCIVDVCLGQQKNWKMRRGDLVGFCGVVRGKGFELNDFMTIESVFPHLLTVPRRVTAGESSFLVPQRGGVRSTVTPVGCGRQKVLSQPVCFCRCSSPITANHLAAIRE
jgi:hypothetical protein